MPRPFHDGGMKIVNPLKLVQVKFKLNDFAVFSNDLLTITGTWLHRSNVTCFFFILFTVSTLMHSTEYRYIYSHGHLLELTFGVQIPAPSCGQVVPYHADNKSHYHWLVRFLPQYPGDPGIKGQNRPIDESIQSLKNRDASFSNP